VTRAASMAVVRGSGAQSFPVPRVIVGVVPGHASAVAAPVVYPDAWLRTRESPPRTSSTSPLLRPAASCAQEASKTGCLLRVQRSAPRPPKEERPRDLLTCSWNSTRITTRNLGGTNVAVRCSPERTSSFASGVRMVRVERKCCLRKNPDGSITIYISPRRLSRLANRLDDSRWRCGSKVQRPTPPRVTLSHPHPAPRPRSDREIYTGQAQRFRSLDSPFGRADYSTRKSTSFPCRLLA